MEWLIPRVTLEEELLQERRRRYPIGAGLSWELLSDHSRIDVLHELREREPVTWCDAVGGWLVSSRGLALEVYRNPETFTVQAAPNLVRAVLGEMMLAVDGDEHTRHRAPFNPSFKFGAVRDRFEASIGFHVNRLLDAVEARGNTELGADFAAPFAIAMAAEVLGLELEQVERLRQTYELFATAMTAYDDPEALERALVARAELGNHLAEQLDAARREGRASLLAEVTEQGLRDEEAIANARVILFGAIETVEGMILNTVWALLGEPAVRREVEADPELLSGAVDEALRLLPPVGFVERWAREDTVLGDAEIGRGDFVVPFIVAANRDPDHFPDPDRFDLGRSNVRQSISFSQGLHHCLGVNLARLEGRIAIAELLRRFPGLRLDPEHPAAPTGFPSRRLAELHLTW